ncbi:hypothetical protein NQ317_000464 [Molorchus minor]|uniref:Integrase catalytic domain-containing protein n=1 Tax=Molorchus minor TaxID=1323400 RepID=A0ABQ9IQI1_9CUCU|nr:hypothetical protein NQ317_000464 [Molorchus minor]
MRRQIQEYVRKCVPCQKYKTQSLKPAGLVQTHLHTNQRFEVLAIDLFGPLPQTPNGNRWIFVIEDTATYRRDLLRYGLPRRIISDNGVQFVSDVMQQVMYTLDVKQNLTPIYHPESNPLSERIMI